MTNDDKTLVGQRLNMLKPLLEKETDVQDLDNFTLLLAAKQGNTSTLKQLKASGVNIESSKAFLIAVQHGHLDVIRLLQKQRNMDISIS